MDVRFGVHTGLQHTTIAELQRAVGAHRGARLRLDLDLGPLLRGRRDRRSALPRSDHRRTPRSRCRRRTRHVRLARLLRRLPPPRGARERDGDARPGRGRPHRARSRRRLAAERVRRVRHALRQRPANGCACSTSTSSACAGCSRRTRTTFDGRVLHAAPTRSASRSRCRRGCRSGSAAAARRSRCASPRSTPTAGTCRSSRPTRGRTRRAVLDEHCAAVGRDPGRDHEDGQRRHGVHRRGADSASSARCRTT